MNEEQRRKLQEHNQTPIDDVIAEERLIAIWGNERREVILQIGRPYVEDDGVASCPVAAWGINGRYRDVHGESTLQALYLASNMLAHIIIDLMKHGNVKFYYEDCEDEGEMYEDGILAIFGRSLN